ncbi:MAG: symmetrical bis(5'-nucleosyl)-tetraphosphatase [Gammaproteobacteria bacterium]|nr:symmetrical bis(5'-nucleosyl)-tetraphosphatase [Gammaproteobacteria bacterium]
MADYAIGDVQGCYDALMRLLDQFQFDSAADRLWFVGDLVNRGPQSLEVLRFVSQLSLPPIVTLGNHDLYLLARLFLPDVNWGAVDDTLQAVLDAPDAMVLGHWLRRQPIMYRHPPLGVVMVHAGIAPMWSVEEAQSYALEVEHALRGETMPLLLSQLYGDEPFLWSDSLRGMARLRCITNYFTRMRFCDADGGMCLTYKGTIDTAPSGVIPWFAHPQRKMDDEVVVFGHWAALGLLHPAPNVYALDTGCVWGQTLTAMRLQDKVFFSVEASG